MRRYALYRPGRKIVARMRHWSDDLPPGTAWADVGLQFSVNLQAWAKEHSIPADQAKQAFDGFVQEVVNTAILKAAGAKVAAGSESRTGQRD